MSIKATDKNVQTETQLNESNLAQDAQYQPGVAPTATRNEDFFDDLLGSASDFSGQSNEAIVKAVELLNARTKAQVEANRDTLGLRFIAVDDEQQAALPFIVAYNTQGSARGIYAFLIEEGLYDGAVKNQVETIMGQTIEIDASTAKVYDGLLVKVARNAVAATTGADYTPSGYMVVNKNMDLTNASYLTALFGTAETNLRSFQPENQMPRISGLLQKGVSLNVSHDVHPGETSADLEGSPIRTDVTTTVTIAAPEAKGQSRKSENNRRREIKLAEVETTLDFVFAPAPSWSVLQHSQEQVLRAFHPLLIMSACTGVDGRTKKAIESPATTLFGLLGLGQLAADGNWKTIPRRNLGGLPSLGVLAHQWEPRLGVEFTGEEAAIEKGYVQAGSTAQGLEEFIDRNMHDTISVAIDVLRGGRNNWVYDLFVKAAIGSDEEAYAANAALVHAFDEFTEGQFSQLWSPNAPIVQRGAVAIHAGTYGDSKSGEVKDLRQMTTQLEMTAHYSTDAANHMDEFSRTLVLGGSDGDQGAVNIHHRREVIKQVAPRAVIEGMFDRLLLTPEVLPAFLEACSRANLHPTCEGLYDNTQSSQRGVSGFNAGQSFSAGNVYRQAHNGNGQVAGQGSYVHRPYY